MMNIIIGHTNMDLDCIGSMVLARYLFPDFIPVKSRFIHPVARNLYNLYEYRMSFIPLEDLRNADVERIIVVDTRTRARIAEFLDMLPGFAGRIEVFDHHEAEEPDIPEAIVHMNDCGANTSWLALEMMGHNMEIEPEDATIALTGIYADTGSFSHLSTTESDFQAAAYLIQNGASLGLVKRFLSPLKEDHQVNLFHRMLNEMIYQDFRGHQIGLSYIEMEKQASGLAAVVEKSIEVENVDALFSFFSFRKDESTLVIARSRKDTIEVNKLLEYMGGGGHQMAASALVKGKRGGTVFREFLSHLNSTLNPALCAGDIMTTDVRVINPDWPLMEASKYLESINHTGAPVLNGNGEITGFLSLRNIMKGRKSGQMNAPVRAFMTKKVVTAPPSVTLREIEDLFYRHDIGHLPIVEGTKLVGLVTRSDYLRSIDSRHSAQTDGPPDRAENGNGESSIRY